MLTPVSNEERKALAQVSRKLRRVKRQAFLMQVQQPQSNVDQFRRLLLQLATSDDTSVGSASSACCSSFNDSSSSLLSSSCSTMGSIGEDEDECGRILPYPATPHVKMYSNNKRVLHDQSQ